MRKIQQTFQQVFLIQGRYCFIHVGTGNSREKQDHVKAPAHMVNGGHWWGCSLRARRAGTNWAPVVVVPNVATNKNNQTSVYTVVCTSNN